MNREDGYPIGLAHDVGSLIARAFDLADLRDEVSVKGRDALLSGIHGLLTLAFDEIGRQDRRRQNAENFDSNEVTALTGELQVVRKMIPHQPDGITELFGFVDHALESGNPFVLKAAIAGVKAVLLELAGGRSIGKDGMES